MSREEAQLDFSQPAQRLHDKVRAFAGWPGTFAPFTLLDDASGKAEAVEYKVLRTRVASAEAAAAAAAAAGGGGGGAAGGEVAFAGGSMLVRCGGGSALEVLQVQPPGKKAMAARDLRNGLGKRRLLAGAGVAAAVGAVGA
jgi:methionyl-tRNA formyltransferase